MSALDFQGSTTDDAADPTSPKTIVQSSRPTLLGSDSILTRKLPFAQLMLKYPL